MPAVHIIKSVLVGYNSNNDLARLVELGNFCSAEEGHVCHIHKDKSLNFKSSAKLGLLHERFRLLWR